MRFVTIQVPDNAVATVLNALVHLVPPSAIQLFAPMAIPPTPEDDGLDGLAQEVAEAIRPKPNQLMRKEALKKLLTGHDTFWNQQGEPDPALRNAMGAISKALRKVFSHTQAVRRLAEPKKTFMKDGSYRGTIYEITPLGKRVRDLLKAEGSI